MTIEETKKKIEVMQSYVEGEKIECATRCISNEYSTVSGPIWNWEACTYRIKKPRWKDITVNEALDLLKTGPKRARFSDDKKYWAGSDNYHMELDGFSLCGELCFLYKNVGYRYCQILEED